MKSIRRTLLLWLYAGLATGIAVAGVSLYYQAREEANRIFDFQLRELAASLPSQPFAFSAPSRPSLPDSAILIQIWNARGLRVYRSHEGVLLSPLIPLGFSNVDTQAGVWRVYSLPRLDGLVQVAQPLSARRQLAADTAFKTLLPLLLLFPFLGVLVWVTVSAGLAPVQRVAREVQARDAAALAPIARGDLPVEIQPLARALNDLLARLQHALGAQRSFVADAAHELRSPLTALQLQIQLAERAHTDEERVQAFADLKQGYARAMNMVQQLLTLARQEPGAAAGDRSPVDLRATAQQVIAEHAPLAEQRGIDLGLVEADEAVVSGDADALHILVGNLISNAIRHSPDHTRVDVSVQRRDGEAVVRVQDAGPGIPDFAMERVFDRFYRVPGTDTVGSGLGLAIARQIAEAHGARLNLTNTHPGLRAEVSMPVLTQDRTPEAERPRARDE